MFPQKDPRVGKKNPCMEKSNDPQWNRYLPLFTIMKYMKSTNEI